MQQDREDTPAAETEEERAERWRKFWAEPPPGWEGIDLSPEDIRQARNERWTWEERIRRKGHDEA